jgi:hypothetical protein
VAKAEESRLKHPTQFAHVACGSQRLAKHDLMSKKAGATLVATLTLLRQTFLLDGDAAIARMRHD